MFDFQILEMKKKYAFSLAWQSILHEQPSLEQRLCVRLLEVINTTWENLHFTKHNTMRRSFCSPNWSVCCNLQIFSGVLVTSAAWASSCTISFSISNSFWYYMLFHSFFNGKKGGASWEIDTFGCRSFASFLERDHAIPNETFES